MSGKSWNLGLIGWPLDHSYSPRLHQAALEAAGLDGDYRLMPVPPAPEGSPGLEQALEDLRQGDWDGLNVTIPHKRTVLPYLDQLSQTAQGVGAVNTIIRRSGGLIGENTDVPGFLADLRALNLPDFGEAIILGAGGAAMAAAYALATEGWEVRLASRRLTQAENAADWLRQSIDPDPRSPPATAIDLSGLARFLRACSLVVNATPVGMYPRSEESPWPAGLSLPPSSAVYDIVYNPLETRLVRDARAAGLPARGGIGMLIEQAALAFEAWTGFRPSREAMAAAVGL
jgi:shikimate dehydrogenase